VVDDLPAHLLVSHAHTGRVIFANRACRDLWDAAGSSELSLLQERMRCLAADPNLIPSLWEERAARALGEQCAAGALVLRDGRHFRWRTTAIRLPGEQEAGELHLFEEVRRRAPAAPVADDLFRVAFEKAAVGIAILSGDGHVMRANASFCRLVGYREPELANLRLQHLTHRDDPSRDELWGVAPGLDGDSFHQERRFVHRQGGTVWAYLSVSVVRDAGGAPMHFIALAEDITARKREEEAQERRTRELLALANLDPLTGLYNHRFMQEVLTERLADARRHREPLSVLMLDLDRFRELNERHGHDAGDRALRSVAETLQEALRDGDLACRYGGEEFLLILNATPLDAALLVADRIRARVEAIPPVAAHAGPVTCSIGVAGFPTHASTTASLLKAADVAVYQAKHQGRNQVCGYEPIPFDSPHDHLEKLKTGLQGASLEAVNALITAIDLRDRYTGAHCQRAARLAVELGIRLGCADSELEILRLGAPLIDVGKIGLPDYLLTKPAELTPEEWTLVRHHPTWGEQLVLHTALPPETLEIVRWHHERLDGSGYPDGLAGEQIPLLPRIVAVADVATALLEERPHRAAWPLDRVLEYLRSQGGKTLDARVVQAFCDLQSA
jgi:diguanylate cyclase (GGDEF)-like protein/PAS domain S-box-containing protein